MRKSSAAVPAPFHALRAGMLASGVVGLAAAAHVMGGGALPPLPVLLAIVTLTALAATAATRVKLNAAAILAALGTGQLALHWALAALSPALNTASQPHRGSHAGHSSQEHTELLAALPSLAAQNTAEPVPGLFAAGTGMLLAHAGATVLCALLLSHGEAALWALAAWLRPLVSLPEAMPHDAVSVPAAAVPPPSPAFRPWRNLRQNSRRGPPAAVVVS